DGPSVTRAPVAPLRAINPAQAAVIVRPFVPDGYAVFVKIFDVRVAAQEPEQLVNDGFGMDFLGREQRKIFPQIKPRLRAEHGIRARAGAVGLGFSVLKDVPQQVEVLNHCEGILTAKRTKYTKRNSVASPASSRPSPPGKRRIVLRLIETPATEFVGRS